MGRGARVRALRGRMPGIACPPLARFTCHGMALCEAWVRVVRGVRSQSEAEPVRLRRARWSC
jgi:hypothetical protein